MKKIIFTSLIAVISLSTFAQGKSGKNKNHHGNEVFNKNKEHDDDRYKDRDKKNKKDKNDDRDEDRNEDRDRNDRRDRDENRRDRDENRRDNTGKYSKNTPRKVADVFARDFPNATNVSWTKNSGTWTAHFGGGGIIPNTRTVTYRANGQRVSSNGIFR